MRVTKARTGLGRGTGWSVVTFIKFHSTFLRHCQERKGGDPGPVTMSSKQYESVHGQRSEADRSSGDMRVPRSDVSKFLETLKSYYDSCSESKKQVFAACAEVKVVMKDFQKFNTSCQEQWSDIMKTI